jgi:hypothetical protein
MSDQKEPIEVKVLPTSGMVETPSDEEKEILEAQRAQLYDKSADHAPATPQTLTDAGAPPAQGPNIGKEDAEYAVNAAANSTAEEVPEEKIPAPIQASEEPKVEAGQAPKEEAIQAPKTAAKKK